jgi:hypothetical protein
MPNLVPIDINQMPVAMRARIASGVAVNTNFSGGIIESFPMLSIRGRAFYVRTGGQDYPYLDPNTGLQMNALNVVLINASKALSKSYYAGAYSSASNMNQPDCWSLDSVRPDASIQSPVNPTCADCPMNKFDSAPRRDPNTKSGKACSDYRRVAVVLPHQLADDNPQMLLLRVPATSLKNLMAHTDHLGRFGVDVNGVITRLSFEPVEWPKLQFDYAGPLNDQQYARATELANSPTVQSMLRSPDFSGALSPTQTQPVLAPQVGYQPAPVVTERYDGTTGEIIEDAPIAQNPVFQQTAQTLSQPIQASPMPKLEVVQSGLIELPDGKLFDPVTKQYVEREQPKDMPELDPDVMELPDGKFYNQVTKQYVEGPNKHAKPAVAEPAKRTRTRTAKPQTDTPAHAQPQPEPVQPQVSAAPVQAPQAQQEAVKQEAAPVTAAPLNGPQPVVQAAPKAMEAFLSKLMLPTEK